MSEDENAGIPFGESCASGTYESKACGIHISVEPFYMEDHSEPDRSYFVWAYKVQIQNTRAEVVQLRTRYWHITDSMGRVVEVRGMGVVGEQPVLKPGETYEYMSGTPLSTPSGIMCGNYGMQTATGEDFEVPIPAFSLDSPYQSQSVN